MDSGALDGLGAEHHRSRVAHFAARATNTFAYDQPNRLKTATVAGAGETYAYDGDGTRFSRQIGANPAIRYVSDPNASLPVTLDDGTHKYVWGLGLAYTVAGSGIEIYHADRLGSTRLLTDATGTITATYRTDEWGVATSQTGSSTQPFGYTGEPRDATGLTYLRARYYDPSLGRFMSRDTLAAASSVTGLNRVIYVADNPATLIDPTGRKANVLDYRPGIIIGAKRDNKQFSDAIRSCEQEIGRRLNAGERRTVHNLITGQGMGYWEIVQACKDEFGDPASEPEPVDDPEVGPEVEPMVPFPFLEPGPVLEPFPFFEPVPVPVMVF